jgi:two-component system, NarL family, sensor histidine kinase BarA
MAQGISLANKCQILFGVAVVALLGGALAGPWIRTGTIVTDSQRELSHELANEILSREAFDPAVLTDPISGRLYRVGELVGESQSETDPFLRDSFARFSADAGETEQFAHETIGGRTRYRYARVIREAEWREIAPVDFVEGAGGSQSPARPDDAVAAVLVIDRKSDFAEAQILANRVYIVASGIVAVALSMLVFHLILRRLIFGPVRALTGVAERVEQGSTTARARLATGDDFERLSRAFDEMLDRLEEGQRQLRAVNESLDLKIGELAEANVGLFESNRLKSEFLANVSHELRTPLNSIIGFAELLDEIARNDPSADPKRRRYIGNILQSGRNLLEMINELLQMAKIEAGRLEVTIGPASVKDVVEGLAAIMRPQSLAKRITVETEIEDDLPGVESDAGKLQQILFNFVSNAVKFSPEDTRVVISARRSTRADGTPCVVASVSDEGPGIPLDMQDTIFEKFRQVDASHTRAHSGTGLGLAICRELAERLGARVALQSVPGRGATFSVEVPLDFKGKQLEALMPEQRA